MNALIKFIQLLTSTKARDGGVDEAPAVVVFGDVGGDNEDVRRAEISGSLCHLLKAAFSPGDDDQARAFFGVLVSQLLHQQQN